MFWTRSHSGADCCETEPEHQNWFAMTSIAEWLASIGLAEYEHLFTENGIDLSVVCDLTEQDLKDLGIVLGHRRKMLRAMAELPTRRSRIAPAPAELSPHTGRHGLP